jgi:hypothetical protein
MKIVRIALSRGETCHEALGYFLTDPTTNVRRLLPVSVSVPLLINDEQLAALKARHEEQCLPIHKKFGTLKDGKPTLDEAGAWVAKDPKKTDEYHAALKLVGNSIAEMEYAPVPYSHLKDITIDWVAVASIKWMFTD